MIEINSVYNFVKTNISFKNSGVVLIDSKEDFIRFLFNKIYCFNLCEKDDIKLNGKNVNTLSEEELSNYRRKSLGAINFYDDKIKGTVKKYILKNEMYNYTNEEIINVLNKIGLNIDLNKNIKELSSHEIDLLKLAKVLIKNPKIILINYIDGREKNDAFSYFEILKKLSNDRLIIISSLFMKNEISMYDRYIQVIGGKIVADEVNSEASSKEISLDNDCFNSLKTSFFKNFKNPFKLVFSRIKYVILTIVFLTLALFGIGVASSIVFYSQVYAISSSIKDGNKHKAIVNKTFDVNTKEVFIDNDGKETTLLNNQYKDIFGLVNKKEIDELNKNSLGLKYCGYSNISLVNYEEDSILHSRKIEGVVSANQEIMDYYGFKLIAGKYPSELDEIAISTFTADSWLYYNKDLTDYQSLLGYKINKYAKISAIYDMGDISSFGNETNDSYSILEKNCLNIAFSTEGFITNYKQPIRSNSKGIKAVSITENPLIRTYVIGDSRHNYESISGCYIPYEDEDFSSYTFFDKDGNEITPKPLGDLECYINYDISRGFGNTFEVECRDDHDNKEFHLDLKVVGYYKNPNYGYDCPIASNSTFTSRNRIAKGKFEIRCNTDYAEPKDAIYDGVFTMSKYSVREVRNLTQNGKNYEMRIDGTEYAYTNMPNELKRDLIIFLVLGGVFIVLSFGIIRRLNSKFYDSDTMLKYKTNGNSNKEIKKYIIFGISLLLIIPFVLSILGINLYLLVLNASIPIIIFGVSRAITFNVFGYVLILAILITLLGISIYDVLKKKIIF